MLLAGAPTAGGAQAGADQATLFLLLPLSARGIAVGQAMMTVGGTSDALWWNPAGLASVRRREVSLHHSQSVVGTGEALALVAPLGRLGVATVGVNVLDFGGDIPAVDNQGNVVGKILPRNLALVGSLARSLGPHARVGVAYKQVQFRFDCEGLCPSIPTSRSATPALDAGLQVDLPSRIPMSFGAAIRNVGVRLPADSLAARDALPPRLQAGVSARYRLPARYANDAEVLVALDLVDDLPVRRPLPRIGVQLGWERRAFLRAGYVVTSGTSESAGPTLGMGVVARRVVIDFARVLAGLSADAGQAPTYLSLRIRL